MQMLDGVKFLRRKAKAQRQGKCSDVTAEPTRDLGSRKSSTQSRTRENLRTSRASTSSTGSRVRFDWDAGSSLHMHTRHPQAGQRSAREPHSGRKSETHYKRNVGRRSRSIAGRILAGGCDGGDIPLTVRRAKSGGWCDVNVGGTEKKKTGQNAVVVYRKDSKSDLERVEEMCKLASECSGSSGSASLRSVWHSLIAIENEI